MKNYPSMVRRGSPYPHTVSQFDSILKRPSGDCSNIIFFATSMLLAEQHNDESVSNTDIVCMEYFAEEMGIRIDATYRRRHLDNKIEYTTVSIKFDGVWRVDKITHHKEVPKIPPKNIFWIEPHIDALPFSYR